VKVKVKVCLLFQNIGKVLFAKMQATATVDVLPLTSIGNGVTHKTFLPKEAKVSIVTDA
jgi:hypothetical protein